MRLPINHNSNICNIPLLAAVYKILELPGTKVGPPWRPNKSFNYRLEFFGILFLRTIHIVNANHSRVFHFETISYELDIIQCEPKAADPKHRLKNRLLRVAERPFALTKRSVPLRANYVILDGFQSFAIAQFIRLVCDSAPKVPFLCCNRAKSVVTEPLNIIILIPNCSPREARGSTNYGSSATS